MNWTIYEMLWKKVEKIVDHLSRRISHITWIDVLLFIVTWLMADISLMIYDLCRSLLVQDKIDRSSHRRCSVKKGVLRNSAKFTGKHLYQSFFFNKVVDLRPETLLKKRLWHICFPVNFAKFLRTRFLQNTSGRLLLTWTSNNYAPSKRYRCCI